MSRFCPLFSSSSGNCSYVGYGDSGILVDAGVSCKNILSALCDRDIDPASIKAVAVTHEHSDHIKGLKVLVKKLKIPVMASRPTLIALNEHGALPDGCEIIEAEGGAVFDDIAVCRFATSHDCKGSSGYTFSLPGDQKFAVCTDLGYISDEVRENLLGCDLVMLESNHDINMLKNGPYPFYLKERILSDCGHLSNGQCASLLPELIKTGTTRFVLAHLSQHNNLPTLAKTASVATLMETGAKEQLDYILYVAPKEGGRILAL